MAHCDCNHEVDSNVISTIGDNSKYQALMADMPSSWFNPQKPAKATEEKKSSGFVKKQWNMNVYAAISKTLRIARIVVLAGATVAAVIVALLAFI